MYVLCLSMEMTTSANRVMEKYIAHRLLENNEQKRWRDPSILPSPIDDEPHPESTIQDDEIFKMARLINCKAFRNVVVEDFLKGLLGLANVGNSAGLDLFKVADIPSLSHM